MALGGSGSVILSTAALGKWASRKREIAGALDREEIMTRSAFPLSTDEVRFRQNTEWRAVRSGYRSVVGPAVFPGRSPVLAYPADVLAYPEISSYVLAYPVDRPFYFRANRRRVWNSEVRILLEDRKRGSWRRLAFKLIQAPSI